LIQYHPTVSKKGLYCLFSTLNIVCFPKTPF
jgi:hypothetical protein